MCCCNNTRPVWMQLIEWAKVCVVGGLTMGVDSVDEMTITPSTAFGRTSSSFEETMMAEGDVSVFSAAASNK